MKCFEAPNELEVSEKSVFMAGGISGCLDWQKELIKLLENEQILIINPRRREFHFSKEIEKQQIAWEHKYLRKADAVSFWFPKETVCPITLFELGTVLMLGKTIFIGIDPEYSRKSNVEIQSKLVHPEIKFFYSVKDLGEEIKKWNEHKN